MPWKAMGYVAYVAVNLYFIATWMNWSVYDHDLDLWASLPAAIAEGTLYNTDTTYPFVWSPVIAPVQAAVGLIGFWPQAVICVAIPFMLRDWRMTVLILSSFMFWPAVLGANPLFVLMLVAAVLAWRGSDTWSLIYLGMSLMIPRPLHIPLAALLLWLRPALRVRFAFLVAVHAIVVAATGYAFDWLGVVGQLAGEHPPFDLGPRAFVGIEWLALGIPAAVALTFLRRPGWAGLMLSPYWLHGYTLWPLIEIGTTGDATRVSRRWPSRGSEHVDAPTAGGADTAAADTA